MTRNISVMQQHRARLHHKVTVLALEETAASHRPFDDGKGAFILSQGSPSNVPNLLVHSTSSVSTGPLEMKVNSIVFSLLYFSPR